jgi:hypothetical protein
MGDAIDGVNTLPIGVRHNHGREPARLGRLHGEVPKKKRIVAYHEAGYAVAARQFGVAVDNVTTVTADDEYGEAMTMREGAPYAVGDGSPEDLQKCIEIDIKISRVHAAAWICCERQENRADRQGRREQSRSVEAVGPGTHFLGQI